MLSRRGLGIHKFTEGYLSNNWDWDWDGLGYAGYAILRDTHISVTLALPFEVQKPITTNYGVTAQVHLQPQQNDLAHC